MKRERRWDINVIVKYLNAKFKYAIINNILRVREKIEEQSE